MARMYVENYVYAFRFQVRSPGVGVVTVSRVEAGPVADSIRIWRSIQPKSAGPALVEVFANIPSTFELELLGPAHEVRRRYSYSYGSAVPMAAVPCDVMDDRSAHEGVELRGVCVLGISDVAPVVQEVTVP